MPKQKTHKGAAKRFDVTGSGKIRFRKSWQNHRRRKSDQNLRLLGRMQVVPSSELSHLRQALSYCK
ncbi:MAG: 50S ribosomal protein L35 [Chloroflexi bacterium]|nr:50S ribosomal protein L35 [Chloroflexota bacterium]MCL5946858.1 50S ribosomal protein L35 [Chloroflexota bacterium]